MYEVAVIGAGPAGLTAAIYCGRAGLKTVVFGLPYESQVAKTDVVENYPGFESVRGMDLIEKMVAQASRYAEIREEIVGEIRKDEFFHLISSTDDVSKVIILCTGAKERELGVRGEKELFGRGVSYCAVCDGALFKGKTVAVAGFGNGAARSALYLSQLCREVHLLCTKERLKCEAVYLKRIEGSANIRLVEGAKILEILGAERVEGISYEKDGRKELKVNGVFIACGTKPNSELAVRLGVETRRGYVVTREGQRTNVDGVFAAGDVTGPPKQVATAVGEGAEAALSAIDYLTGSRNERAP